MRKQIPCTRRQNVHASTRNEIPANTDRIPFRIHTRNQTDSKQKENSNDWSHVGRANHATMLSSMSCRRCSNSKRPSKSTVPVHTWSSLLFSIDMPQRKRRILEQSDGLIQPSTCDLSHLYALSANFSLFLLLSYCIDSP